MKGSENPASTPTVGDCSGIVDCRRLDGFKGVKNWSRRLVTEGDLDPRGRSGGDKGGGVMLGLWVGEVGGESGGDRAAVYEGK